MRRLRNHVVLHVDDDADDVHFVRRAFARVGVDAVLRSVSDGPSAIEYLEGRAQYADRSLHPLPTLVLLDLKLPGMNGFEVLRRIRSAPEHRRTIVVVLTGSAEIADIRRAYEGGASSYLVKPGDPRRLEELLEALKRYWLEANEPPPLS